MGKPVIDWVRIGAVFIAGLSVMLLNMHQAEAIQLSPDQLKMAAGLSGKQKADLARQAGISLPSDSKKSAAEIARPTVIKVRKVGTSNLESQTQAKPESAELQAATGNVEVPVVEVKSQKGAEALAVRRAFADFARDAKPLSVDTNLKQFGYELFAGSPDTFAPATDVPVPAEYVLGPGDELNIHLYGRKDQELVLVVDREGEIAFPSLGPLSVAGMSFAEAKAFIAQQVKEKLVGITADISMGKLRSIRIFALGDVERPGSYTVSGLSTISNALFVSGGIKKTGSLRNIQLKRNGQVMAVIDLYDFLLKGDTSEDERLMPGDVVFVPPIGKTAGVAGQVIRPAIYELKREHSVGDLIRLSGGLLPTAYKDMALIERIAPTGGRSVLKISLSKPKPVTRLKNGDLLKVFSVSDYENNPVYLLGHVKRPGKYAWHKGMYLKELLPSTDMLLPEAKLDYGVIERESGINRETSIVHFNVLEAINSKRSILLQPRDKVYVFKRAQLREMPTIQITGSVQNPGTYEAKKNMRLWDLVMAAGGLKRDALLTDVEVYHENPNSKEITVAHYALGKGSSLSNQDNPLLADQDRVVVHSIWEVKKKYMVSVSGEVKHPGEFTLAAGMRLTDLLFAAGNVTERAYMQQAEITRYTVENNQRRVSKHIQVDLARALHGDGAANIQLTPHDVLMVRRMANWRDIEHVSIKGEVNFPGNYPVEDGEHLSSLLERAGGLTNKAYLEAAVFIRASIRESQQQKLTEMSRQVESEIARLQSESANLSDPKLMAQRQSSIASAKKMLEEMKKAKATGRLVIHIRDVQAMKGKDFDITLHDGDSLYIPKRPDEILVMGQVYNNNAMLYQRQLSVDDYISRAGGFTRLADEDHIYVVHASGIVEPVKGGWHRTKLKPGDAIVVPENLEQFNLLGSALDWSKVLYQFGTALAAMKVIGIL